MNKTNTLLRSVVLLCLCLLTSCIYEDDYAYLDKNGGANLIISVANPNGQQLTRANSERTDRNRIDNMNIVLVNGEQIQKIIYIDEKVTPNDNIDQVESGLISGQLPTTDSNFTLSYHVGTADFTGITDIYVVCNYWDVDEEGNINEDHYDLNNINIKTVEELRSLQQGTPWNFSVQTSTLFGRATEMENGADEHGGGEYSVLLERTTAMVTVAIENAGLNEGVKISPRSICLHNVPKTCYIGQENRIGGVVEREPEGLVQSVGWDALTSSNRGTTVGGHGADENVLPLFMFENMQGIMDNAFGDEVKKTPDAGKEDLCSYIEVVADYLYAPTSSEGNQKYISGPIKYRLYLGENVTTDFNVKRNMHYQVTLRLNTMGGLVEDGRTYSDGSYIGDGEDASWRVESSGVTGGGSFLTDGLNMASNGFESYVGFVGEPNVEYIVYAPDGFNKCPWLWAELETGINTPSELYSAKIYTAEECGGEPGVSYIRLYAQTWLDEYPYEWRKYGGNTVTSWIENGVREAELVLAEAKTGKIVSELTVRQWLPMPVMIKEKKIYEDTWWGQGDLIRVDTIPITDPNEALFYYSRIDVYDGKEIGWAPEFYNTWDADDLYTTGLGFNREGRQDKFPEGYNSDYGFDNCAALYYTDLNKTGRQFTFDQDYGRPAYAMGVAIFRAGNSVTSSGGTITKPPFRMLGRIGLPTKEEWQKIIKYGAVDMRFGISDVPYWTSSMEGTESYTVNPVTGEERKEYRGNKYRVRLLYHKGNMAEISKY